MARSPSTDATSETEAAGSRRVPDAKSRVTTAIGQLVEDGRAEWRRTATGDIELRLLTGEVFVLGEMFVTRVA
ncbi:hypothetical protein [Mesorhizobium sp. M7A.F.Ca.US.006.01.1.1]|uniref:hypothetical protein n=1 Tax=Mesorhizobium sp. M7A.F.Ca.US.006.01.1.1 TaxID=2496707 RepID=UPI001FE09BA3|nr:hypothetical protein [Mesorhizobium sp. M7A.F.Ca.US.006.01.1.1]